MSQQFPDIDFEHYHKQVLPTQLDEGRARMAARAATKLRPLAFRVGGKAYTYSIENGAVALRAGEANASTVIGLSARHWQDLVHDLESAPGLLYNNLLESSEGDSFQLMQWEPALRAMYRGIPPYDSSMAELRDRNAELLPVDKLFTLGDRDEDMVDFLEAAGYLLVKSVFSSEEVATFREQAELLRASAVEGDKISWWGVNSEGGSVVTRVLKASIQPAFKSLYEDERMSRLGDLPPMICTPGAQTG